MKLSDLFRNLSFGLLSNLAIGGNGSGTIPVEHHNRLLSHVNHGLLTLYSRFFVNAKEITIQGHEEIQTYKLKTEHAVTDSTTDVDKYILDTIADPFLGDVLKILDAYDDDGETRPLNDLEDPRSWFTPAPNFLQIPEPVNGEFYGIIYQAKHPHLVPDDLDQKIILPEVLQEALDFYVAYRVLSGMNGQEHSAKAAEYFQQYSLVVDRVEQFDLLLSSQMHTTSKLIDRGFK